MRTPLLWTVFAGLIIVGCGQSGKADVEATVQSEKDEAAFRLAREQWQNMNHQAAIDQLTDLIETTADATLKDKAKARLDSVKAAMNQFNRIVAEAEAKEAAQRDSIKAALLPMFRVEDDDFKGVRFYEAKSVPKYVDVNSVHLYIGQVDSTTMTLRLKLQYHADDWLFIDKVQIQSNGKVFTLKSREWKRDNGSGSIWEWSDEPLVGADYFAISVLADNGGTIRYSGSKYFDKRMLTKKEVDNLKKTIELFKALGGDEGELLVE